MECATPTSPQPPEVDLSITPILQKKRLRFREVSHVPKAKVTC